MKTPEERAAHLLADLAAGALGSKGLMITKAHKILQDHIREAEKAARVKAFEEAIKVAEDHAALWVSEVFYRDAARQLAASLRALAQEKTK